MVIFIFTIEIASDLMDTDMLKIKANITHSMFDFTANKIDFE
jgi:hypothetical protein